MNAPDAIAALEVTEYKCGRCRRFIRSFQFGETGYCMAHSSYFNQDDSCAGVTKFISIQVVGG